MHDLILSPSDFIAFLNQTLEFAYPQVVIEGELANFRIAKNRWLYFDLKDEFSSVPFFGSVSQLPGPLEDGLTVRVVGTPRMHNRFGFTVNLQSISPVGEGALRKAAELLKAKLAAEGLFDEGRKRPLPAIPAQIGLITAADSAASSDFLKIVNERWGGLEILLADVYVQGDQAQMQLVAAVEHFNQLKSMPDVLVLTRGGGSADDMAAFNDERVVRAVAASRIPTLVAVGHEKDVSLAELAADRRASTPTNAAGLVVPDRHEELKNLSHLKQNLSQFLNRYYDDEQRMLKDFKRIIDDSVKAALNTERRHLEEYKNLSKLLNPLTALKRGYAIVRQNDRYIGSIKGLKLNQTIEVFLADGKIDSLIKGVSKANGSEKIF